MLAMRPATPDDQPGLAALIQARSDWMKANQCPNWRSWGKHVHELASNCTRHPNEMWVLAERGDRILGCTTILRTSAPWTWTPVEAADTAYYLNGTVTDPAERHRKLGTLIADWAVDRAAREGISCVRRDCSSPALAAYYQQQNFQLIRKVSTPGGHTSYALERKAERIPELAILLAPDIPAPGPSVEPRAPLIGNVRSNVVGVARHLSHSLRGVAKVSFPR
ncbi:GNAT family N-acetyltransferase [Streptomyces lavenduligriseus]|uniref:GNAT family N-acetyltransferase n=1 Tax=Streptomyces lavenduligriseus TaxID=67315 RepID=A0ABT0P8A8_9ACTN|nr:GNAT family N-acetyltransferase [Streptomyces lavenduligriseus]MCL3999118.1 GNAT family N-acetyltransferase [Streptomyces lavenduligriseus]